MAESGAQEEALCHESTLYEVLSSPKLSGYYDWNNRHKNGGLNQNRAIYTPDVIFKRDAAVIKADVITCAAPNRKAYMDYIRDANEKAFIYESLARLDQLYRKYCT